MGLRTRNDKITDGERAFIFASIQKANEEGEIPVTVRNLDTKKKTGGNS